MKPTAKQRMEFATRLTAYARAYLGTEKGGSQAEADLARAAVIAYFKRVAAMKQPPAQVHGSKP